MMKRRKVAISFDSLEDRRLMTMGSLFPALGSMRSAPTTPIVRSYDMMEPPAPSAPGDSIVNYDMMEPPTPPTPGDPTVNFEGPSAASIGGLVGVKVVADPMTSYQIKSVKYEIVGDPEIEHQTWDTQTASYVRTSGTTHTFDDSTGYQTEDEFSWNWDEVPGLKTVKVTTTYNDPASTVKINTLTIDVKAPNVEFVRAIGSSFRMGYYPPDSKRFGITNYTTSGNEGVNFTAHVNSTPTGAYFGFVQIMTKGDYTAENNKAIRKVRTPDGGIYLDVAPNASDTSLMGWADVPATDTAVLLNNGADSPGYTTTPVVAGMDTDLLDYNISIDYSFETYLIYQPYDGIKIAVGMVPWDVKATATYNGAKNPINTTAFVNPANWTLTSNRTSLWQENGNTDRKLLEWTKNSSDLNKTVITIVK